jgi:hypothetical protein
VPTLQLHEYGALDVGARRDVGELAVAGSEEILPRAPTPPKLENNVLLIGKRFVHPMGRCALRPGGESRNLRDS